jgi:hypothetical protein
METMGIPDDVRRLLDDWLTDQISYNEANGSNSAFFTLHFKPWHSARFCSRLCAI